MAVAAGIWLIAVYGLWRVYHETASIAGGSVIAVLVLGRWAYYGWLWPKKSNSDLDTD